MRSLNLHWPASRLAVVLALALLLILVLLNATVMEDAYITFRVVDNAVQGFGLRWNVHERVQSYTNPLWMFLHIPFYALWENIYWVTILLSVACTAAAVALVLRTFPRAPLHIICLFLVPLMCSRTFITYCTSGLENPLTHALFAWFGWVLLRAAPKHFWFWASFVTALSLVNRLDTVVFFAPIWGYLLISQFRTIPYRQLAFGALPLIGWELFSLFYYGFPFPNTRYAKLTSSVVFSEYLRNGHTYLLNLAATDIVSALYLLAAVGIIPFLAITFWKQKNSRAAFFLCIAVGIFAYTLYVVSIGGGRQSGRYLSLQVFTSIWLLFGLISRDISKNKLLIFALVLCAIRILAPEPIEVRKYCRSCFRGMAPPATKPWIATIEQGKWKRLPSSGNRARSRNAKEKILVGSKIGKMGFASGPKVIIIDRLGLSDALLARLPSAYKKLMFPGHFWRKVPKGYVDAVATGDMSGMNPDIRVYYRKLKLITSGNLWSWKRVVEIAKFNLGYYEPYRKRYIARNARHAMSRR